MEAEIEGRHLKRFRKVTPRRVNDILGDVGSDLVFLAEDKELAGELAETLQAEGVPAGARGTKRARDGHIYAHWERILEQKTLTAEGCPLLVPTAKADFPTILQTCGRTRLTLSIALFK